MFHAWSWSILSPRLWMVCALLPQQQISGKGHFANKFARGCLGPHKESRLAFARSVRSTRTPSWNTLRLRALGGMRTNALAFNISWCTKRVAAVPGSGLVCLLWNVCSSTEGSARCKLRRPSWSRSTARGTKFALELFLRDVTGEMRSQSTLPVVVV